MSNKLQQAWDEYNEFVSEARELENQINAIEEHGVSDPEYLADLYSRYIDVNQEIDNILTWIFHNTPWANQS
ncbi:MAG TPA: hypothetical protein VGD99_21865 [Anaerolineae bacterium]|jgi:hypothetical protein